MRAFIPLLLFLGCSTVKPYTVTGTVPVLREVVWSRLPTPYAFDKTVTKNIILENPLDTAVKLEIDCGFFAEETLVVPPHSSKYFMLKVPQEFADKTVCEAHGPWERVE